MDQHPALHSGDAKLMKLRQKPVKLAHGHHSIVSDAAAAQVLQLFRYAQQATTLHLFWNALFMKSSCLSVQNVCSWKPLWQQEAEPPSRGEEERVYRYIHDKLGVRLDSLLGNCPCPSTHVQNLTDWSFRQKPLTSRPASNERLEIYLPICAKVCVLNTH